MTSLEKLFTLWDFCQYFGYTLRVHYKACVPSVPVGGLEVVVEPPKQDLLWGQAQELLQRLILVKKTVKLRVKLNVDLSQQATADDLPDETQNQMFSDLDHITSANIDHRAPDTLCRLNDYVVVLRHLESIQGLCFLSSQVQDSLVNSVGHTVVDELSQD